MTLQDYNTVTRVRALDPKNVLKRHEVSRRFGRSAVRPFKEAKAMDEELRETLKHIMGAIVGLERMVMRLQEKIDTLGLDYVVLAYEKPGGGDWAYAVACVDGVRDASARVVFGPAKFDEAKRHAEALVHDDADPLVGHT